MAEVSGNQGFGEVLGSIESGAMAGFDKLAGNLTERVRNEAAMAATAVDGDDEELEEEDDDAAEEEEDDEEDEEQDVEDEAGV